MTSSACPGRRSKLLSNGMSSAMRAPQEAAELAGCRRVSKWLFALRVANVNRAEFRHKSDAGPPTIAHESVPAECSGPPAGWDASGGDMHRAIVGAVALLTALLLQTVSASAKPAAKFEFLSR